MNGAKKIELKPSRSGGPVILFAAVSLTLFFSFIVPLPGKILDVLWICSFCLSLGVSIICIVAQSSSDLMGFIPMMVVPMVLRLVSLIAVASYVIRDEPAGTMIGVVGSALGTRWPLGVLMVCLLSALIVIAAIFLSCQKITLASKGYLGHVFPLKRMGIDTDLRLGVINEEQADQLSGRIVLEYRFFSGIGRVGLFMRIESVVYICVLLMCLMLWAAKNTMSMSPDSTLLSGIVGPVIAMAIFTLIPAMIVAISCSALLSKDTLALRSNDPEPSAGRHVKKVTIVALDSEGPQEELLSSDLLLPKAGEYVVEFEPEAKTAAAKEEPSVLEITCRNTKEYYEKLSGIICSVQEKLRVILLVSDKVNSLPVTVPINIAIRLSQKHQKVLLVDADPQRNAVANVFDLNPETLKTKVVPSCLESLSVCSVPEGRLPRFLQKEKILSHFDTTLIYVPQIPEFKAIPGQAAKPGAFYFIDDKTDVADQRAVEQLGFCGWIGMVPSIQSVLEGRR